MTGVSIRTVHDVAGLGAVSAYFGEVWRTPRTAPPYPAEVLHSLVHAGGAVHAAYDGERLAGACVAVFGPPGSGEVYSLVAAAEPGLGPLVKQAQRDWALGLGARTMRWTFDPLVARNARFNLAKLGAVGTEYVVDFYGPMRDGVNDGDESDRLTVTWDLVSPGALVGPYDPGERGAAPATHRAPDGATLARRDLADLHVWCRVPDDVVKLRAADPALALRWRRAVREVFTEAFGQGFRATGMSRDGWYTLTRENDEEGTV
ncbi:putative GNAT superfamily acetyltransferase [Streptomyces sp. SAI-144]|uniref:chorismate synthase n=1 Tax=Streptomyces sp. SAI-144 TaxID=2940544 RepID=UPI0024752547|nr:chorismate synthase [Streptomyces sp. SAI-144]MDH6434738.1 putative GNAT superfamily acetyltransferase [Streptomyces sp. SAI-144]